MLLIAGVVVLGAWFINCEWWAFPHGLHSLCGAALVSRKPSAEFVLYLFWLDSPLQPWFLWWWKETVFLACQWTFSFCKHKVPSPIMFIELFHLIPSPQLDGNTSAAHPSSVFAPTIFLQSLKCKLSFLSSHATLLVDLMYETYKMMWPQLEGF